MAVRKRSIIKQPGTTGINSLDALRVAQAAGKTAADQPTNSSCSLIRTRKGTNLLRLPHGRPPDAPMRLPLSI
jgi:phosphopantetheinyl transferase